MIIYLVASDHRPEKNTGASFLEFALVIPLIMLLLVSFIDLCRFMVYRGLVSRQLSKAMSYASVVPHLEDSSLNVNAIESVKARVRDLPLGAEKINGDVIFELPQAESGGLGAALANHPMRLAVTLTWPALNPLFGNFSFTAERWGYRETTYKPARDEVYDCSGNPVVSGEPVDLSQCDCSWAGEFKIRNPAFVPGQSSPHEFCICPPQVDTDPVTGQCTCLDPLRQLRLSPGAPYGVACVCREAPSAHHLPDGSVECNWICPPNAITTADGNCECPAPMVWLNATTCDCPPCEGGRAVLEAERCTCVCEPAPLQDVHLCYTSEIKACIYCREGQVYNPSTCACVADCIDDTKTWCGPAQGCLSQDWCDPDGTSGKILETSHERCRCVCPADKPYDCEGRCYPPCAPESGMEPDPQSGCACGCVGETPVECGGACYEACPPGQERKAEGCVCGCIDACADPVMIQDPETCGCECPADYFECGGMCKQCSGGKVPNPNENCICVCPPGKPVECDGTCLAPCDNPKKSRQPEFGCECRCAEPCQDPRMIQDPDTCSCSCPAGEELCGGICRSCPNNQRPDPGHNCECGCFGQTPVLCGGACYPVCPEGKSRRPEDCEDCSCDAACVGEKSKQNEDCSCSCPDERPWECGSSCYSCPENQVPQPPGCQCGCESTLPVLCGEQCYPACPQGKTRKSPNCNECTCIETTCPDPRMFLDPDTCKCTCPGNEKACNGVCISCPANQVPMPANGCACGCSDALPVLCDGNCYEPCADPHKTRKSGSCGVCTCTEPCSDALNMIQDPNTCECRCKDSTPQLCQGRCYNCPGGKRPNPNWGCEWQCNFETEEECDGICYPKCSDGKFRKSGSCGVCSCVNECQAPRSKPDDNCMCVCPDATPHWCDAQNICIACPENKKPIGDGCECGCMADEVQCGGRCWPVCAPGKSRKEERCDVCTCDNVCQAPKNVQNPDTCQCQCPACPLGSGKVADSVTCECRCPADKPVECDGKCYPACSGPKIRRPGNCSNCTCRDSCEDPNTMVQNPNDCVCTCRSPYISCGQRCVLCTGGKLPDPTNNCVCVCPSMTPVECNNACYAVCPPGQARFLPDCNCSCANTCPEPQLPDINRNCECRCPDGSAPTAEGDGCRPSWCGDGCYYDTGTGRWREGDYL